MARLDVFSGLHPGFIPWALRLVGRAATPYEITSTRRSATAQARLHRRFLAGLSAYPAAPPGRSWHEYGLAFDMVAPIGELRRLGRLWQSWGGTWGGERDPIHFQASTRLLRRSATR